MINVKECINKLNIYVKNYKVISNRNVNKKINKQNKEKYINKQICRNVYVYIYICIYVYMHILDIHGVYYPQSLFLIVHLIFKVH